MPLTREQHLNDLLQIWQEHHLIGDQVTPEDLCQECPEFIEDLRRRIDALHKVIPSAPSGTTVQEEKTDPKHLPLPLDWPRLEGYEILGVLGQGGMGVVYKARQIKADRIVALKMIAGKASLGNQGVERFRREARAVAHLQHPNIVQIYEVDEQDGQPFFSMEYLERGSLSNSLASRPMPPRDAAVLVQTLARAVGAAHRAEVIHRDLKPSNVLLATDGTPKIADFGLAKRLSDHPQDTPSGIIVGTPCYMSPEQAAGRKDVGPAADIYSLGAVLYEGLTGKPPFKADSAMDTMLDVLTVPPTPPRQLNRGVPRVLEAICLKCLEKEPANRYGSADDLADDLGRWLAGESTRARPAGFIRRTWTAARKHPVFATAGLLLLGAVTLLLALHLRSQERRLELAKRDLRAGLPVQWVREDGSLLWSRLAIGGPEVGIVRETNSLSIHTLELALLEILPDVPVKRYRFTVEMSHTDFVSSLGVGLFFGYSVHTIEGTRHHYFYELAFSDKDGTPQAPMILRLRRLTTLPEGQGVSANHFLNINLRGRDAGIDRETSDGWRRISAEVTPERIKVSVGEKKLGEIAIEDLKQEVSNTLAEMEHAPGAYPAFVADGALGLFVHRGAAKFRSIAIQPLKE